MRRKASRAESASLEGAMPGGPAIAFTPPTKFSHGGRSAWCSGGMAAKLKASVFPEHSGFNGHEGRMKLEPNKYIPC